MRLAAIVEKIKKIHYFIKFDFDISFDSDKIWLAENDIANQLSLFDFDNFDEFGNSHMTLNGEHFSIREHEI